MIIKARIKTKPIKQWNVGREFNRRLKKKFDEQDIEIPFPHLTLYQGRDKKGQAAPLNVSIDRRTVRRRQRIGHAGRLIRWEASPDAETRR
jgi:moderate conductance mechanosensitive channel